MTIFQAIANNVPIMILIDIVNSSIILNTIIKSLINKGYSKVFKLQCNELLKLICKSETLINNIIYINYGGTIPTLYEQIYGGFESVKEF